MRGAHLSLEDRKTIQHGIEERLSKAEIARQIGKSPSTISKEIRKHRRFKPSNTYYRNVRYFCANSGNFKECHGCKTKCENFVERTCKDRDRIGVCNKCPSNVPSNACALPKYFYSANKAHEEYLYTLRDSREGVNLKTSEMIAMAETIGPLLKRGQSVYQILAGHPELGISVKTMYTYIETGIFKDYGIDSFSLKRQVSMRQRKKLKSRKSPANYEGHTYEDYLAFRKENPTQPVTEMDTVYNYPEGPYIQTFIFENTHTMIGILHREKTSASMAGTLDMMQELLGADYRKLFGLLITDRGSEFEKHNLFEINYETGEIRTDIFYCDPQAPSQKPHVENNHNYVRDIIPNGVKLDQLTQEDLNMAFSHINSTPRECLNGKTPYEIFEFFYGKEILDKFNIRKVALDEVTLMPYLINLK
ncbi:MAG: IS30 family transposase [Clostridia bacterium]|nr:IS30 family transposase [Clostridia bacterium]